MATDKFKVLERDSILIGVPLIPVNAAARLAAAEAKLIELEQEADGMLVWLRQIDLRLDAIEAKQTDHAMRITALEARP